MIKRLASCIRQYKKVSVLAPLFIVGEGIMEVIIPILMASLIDNGINDGQGQYGSDLKHRPVAGALLRDFPDLRRAGGQVTRRRPPRALPGTCATTCTIRFRNTPFQTSTNSRRPAS